MQATFPNNNTGGSVMTNNARYMMAWALIWGLCECGLMATVEADSTQAPPPECPSSYVPEAGSGSPSTFGTLWEAKKVIPQGDQASKKYIMCEGDKFMFVRTGAGHQREEFIVPFGSLATRWGLKGGIGKLPVRRDPDRKLCLIMDIAQSHNGAQSVPHIFRFQRYIEHEIDHVRMKVQFHRLKQGESCDVRDEGLVSDGLAHADDNV
jgi:hypothetical protein